MSTRPYLRIPARVWRAKRWGRALLGLSVFAAITFAAIGLAPESQRTLARATEGEQSPIQLSCQPAANNPGVIGCTLISSVPLDADEGVAFTVEVGGETQRVTATREENPTFRSGSSCDPGDGHCYHFSFDSPAPESVDLQVSNVQALRDAPASNQQPQPGQQAVAPVPAGDPAPLAPQGRGAPQTENPEPTSDAAPTPTSDTQPAEDAGEQLAQPSPEQGGATPDATSDLPRPQQIAERQRVQEQRDADSDREILDVAAAVREAQQKPDWPGTETRTDPGEHSREELQAEIEVHQRVTQEREEQQSPPAEPEPAPERDDDGASLNYVTPSGADDEPEVIGVGDPGYEERYMQLVISGEPFTVCGADGTCWTRNDR